MVYEKFTKAAGFNRWHDMVPMVSTSQLSYADSIDIGARETGRLPRIGCRRRSSDRM